jgi:hypothetical protein
LGIKFENSGPHTTDRNGKVERKFQNQYVRIRAIINDSEIDGEFLDVYWAESADTMTIWYSIKKRKGLWVNVPKED